MEYPICNIIVVLYPYSRYHILQSNTISVYVLVPCSNQNHLSSCRFVHPKRWYIYIYIYTPSGKHTKNYGTSPCLMGSSTMSLAIFQFAFCMFTRPGRFWTMAIFHYIPLSSLSEILGQFNRYIRGERSHLWFSSVNHQVSHLPCPPLSTVSHIVAWFGSNISHDIPEMVGVP